MKKMTVFTPTYNRASLLTRLYHSLLSQENKDFCWLIVDDGSIDNTNELVNNWLKDDKIDIRYFYKENGGLHTAYNLGIEKANTELFICIDSDDYAPENVIQKILKFWETYGDTKYGGIIGLDYTLSNVPIGGVLPSQKSIHFIEVKIKYSNVGDCKLVHRTELLKQHIPMPVYEGEKNFNPSYIFLKVDKQFPLLIMNENLCFVDYQADGMSNNILKQYRNSPQSFMELRRLYLSLPRTGYLFKARNVIHYISSCIFAKRYRDMFNTSYSFFCFLLLPFGIALNLYVRLKTL